MKKDDSVVVVLDFIINDTIFKLDRINSNLIAVVNRLKKVDF